MLLFLGTLIIALAIFSILAGEDLKGEVSSASGFVIRMFSVLLLSGVCMLFGTTQASQTANESLRSAVLKDKAAQVVVEQHPLGTNESKLIEKTVVRCDSSFKAHFPALAAEIEKLEVE